MSKEEIIRRIRAINPSAEEPFLRDFNQPVLEAYLRRLEVMARQKRQPMTQGLLQAAR